jgi:hypothetical protein
MGADAATADSAGEPRELRVLVTMRLELKTPAHCWPVFRTQDAGVPPRPTPPPPWSSADPWSSPDPGSEWIPDAAAGTQESANALPLRSMLRRTPLSPDPGSDWIPPSQLQDTVQLATNLTWAITLTCDITLSGAITLTFAATRRGPACHAANLCHHPNRRSYKTRAILPCR